MAELLGVHQIAYADIPLVTDSIGYVIGGFNQYDWTSTHRGIILKTNDRGNTWIVMDSTIGDGLLKMHFPTSSVGYTVGANGVVLKIGNANSPSAIINSVSSNKASPLLYPNPFTDYLFLRDKVTSLIKSINVVDSYGKIVWNSYKPFSQQIVSHSNLKNGFYIFELQFNDGRIKRERLIKQ